MNLQSLLCSRATFALMIASLFSFSKADAQDAASDALPQLRVSFPSSMLTEEYQIGKMRLTQPDGTYIELGARFKRRGATAAKYTMKPSFNMKLIDKDGEDVDTMLCQLRTASSWILDAMAIDRIGMRNRVAFDMWNEFSKLPYETKFESRNGTVGRFVEVYLNDTYKGIYCLTDRINRKLLGMKKPKVETNEQGKATKVTHRGILYKHGTNDIAVQEKPMFSEDSLAYVIGYHDAWELTEPEKYPGKAAWKPLEDIYANCHDFAWVKEHFYLNQLAEYQVFIMALGISDNWGNKNAYISVRDISKAGDAARFVYTPWDLDTSLGGHYEGEAYDGNYDNWTPTLVAGASGKPVPFTICNEEPEYKQAMAEAWKRGRSGGLSLESLRKKFYTYRDQFLQSGAWERSVKYWDAQPDRPKYVNDLTKEIEHILVWYAERCKAMDEYFKIPPSAIDAPTLQPHSLSTKTYNLQGQQVPAATKGLVIEGGKKVIR